MTNKQKASEGHFNSARKWAKTAETVIYTRRSEPHPPSKNCLLFSFPADLFFLSIGSMVVYAAGQEKGLLPDRPGELAVR